MTELLIDGAEDAPAAFVFAHGAGAPMDAPFMTAMAQAIAGGDTRVVRFEFPYMAERRTSGARKPPPKAEKLCGFFEDLVADIRAQHVFIGGKSMGGRIASLIAEEGFRAGRIAGLACLGYPFHPPGKPEKMRTEHVKELHTPALILQGTRDPFGGPEEVSGYGLSKAIAVRWIEDGDHDLKPRKASGRTHEANLAEAIGALAAFARGL